VQKSDVYQLFLEDLWEISWRRILIFQTLWGAWSQSFPQSRKLQKNSPEWTNPRWQLLQHLQQVLSERVAQQTFFSNLFGFFSVLLIKKWFTEIVLVYILVMTECCLLKSEN
jgi:hypothetical protein